MKLTSQLLLEKEVCLLLKAQSERERSRFGYGCFQGGVGIAPGSTQVSVSGESPPTSIFADAEAHGILSLRCLELQEQLQEARGDAEKPDASEHPQGEAGDTSRVAEILDFCFDAVLEESLR